MNDELLDIALKMHQELQEFVDDGEQAGCNMKATKSLLAEWDEAYQLFHPWQDDLKLGEDKDILALNL